MLEHGGRLREAATRFRIPLNDWLDLSTGINPNGWTVPAMPDAAWQRLPEQADGLEDAAREYYGSDALLTVAGSQAAIQCLPRLRRPSRVVLCTPSYNEHAHAWLRAGHELQSVSEDSLTNQLDWADVLVLVNPNNPTGKRYTPENLLEIHRRLARKGGWLVVDEAFLDATPEDSLIPHGPLPGLIVLRSLGKFFGLAGARVGFVFSEVSLLQELAEWLGPWTITHPSRWIATRALNDREWQTANRATLVKSGIRLRELLTQQGLVPHGGCALFQWVQHPRAPEFYEAFAQRGILLRLFKEPMSLRFGLPANEREWQRLSNELAKGVFA